jgi:hypothetical protein
VVWMRAPTRRNVCRENGVRTRIGDQEWSDDRAAKTSRGFIPANLSPSLASARSVLRRVKLNEKREDLMG